MKVLLAAACLALAAVANANPCTIATAVTEPSGGCSIGALTFTDFNYSSPTVNGSLVTISPLSDVNGTGFDINPDLTLGPNATGDEKLSFAVTAAAGTSINDAFIFFNGNGLGTFATNFNELICTGVTTQAGCTAANEVTLDAANPPPSLQDHLTFADTSQLFVLKDFGASTGANGSVDISDLKNEFSTTSAAVTPEPATIALMGLGLLTLGIRRRAGK
jgi:hypothetical protein